MEVIERLTHHPALAALPWVIDPVLRSSSGAELVEGGPASYEALLLRTTVVTPNVAEALELGRRWLSRDGHPSDDELIHHARQLLGMGAGAVLLKGGHLEGAPVDRLLTSAGMERLEGMRLPGTRMGTGCRLASFLAARLAAGDLLLDAARGAKAYVASYLGREVV